MLDPGGVGEWSPPQSPFGGFRGKNIRIVHNASDDIGAESCYNFSSPPFAPLWGAAGDHFIVPRTPFRMASNAIYIRLSSKVEFCPIYSDCASMRNKDRDKEVLTFSGLDGWFELRA